MKVYLNVLAHREHWVITRDKDYKVPNGVKVFHSREDVLSELGDRRAFVIGGSSIYDMFINDVTSIYVTKVDKKKKADTYFKFSRDDFSWSQIGMQQNDIDGLSGERLNYTFEVYTRKNLLKVIKGEDSTLQNLT